MTSEYISSAWRGNPPTTINEEMGPQILEEEEKLEEEYIIMKIVNRVP